MARGSFALSCWWGRARRREQRTAHAPGVMPERALEQAIEVGKSAKPRSVATSAPTLRPRPAARARFKAAGASDTCAAAASACDETRAPGGTCSRRRSSPASRAARASRCARADTRGRAAPAATADAVRSITSPPRRRGAPQPPRDQRISCSSTGASAITASTKRWIACGGRSRKIRQPNPSRRSSSRISTAARRIRLRRRQHDVKKMPRSLRAVDQWIPALAARRDRPRHRRTAACGRGARSSRPRLERNFKQYRNRRALAGKTRDRDPRSVSCTDYRPPRAAATRAGAFVHVRCRKPIGSFQSFYFGANEERIV